jgi:hypothetical protein
MPDSTVGMLQHAPAWYSALTEVRLKCGEATARVRDEGYGIRGRPRLATRTHNMTTHCKLNMRKSTCMQSEW